MVAHYFALTCCTAFLERVVAGINAHLKSETTTFWVTTEGRTAWPGGSYGRLEVLLSRLPDGRKTSYRTAFLMFPGCARLSARDGVFM
jgi:hypothetical protein